MDPAGTEDHLRVFSQLLSIVNLQVSDISINHADVPFPESLTQD